MPYKMTVEDQEAFRDSFNVDDAVLEYKAPRFYHYVVNDHDVLYDTQVITGMPYTVFKDVSLIAFCLDNDIEIHTSRALLDGTPLTRIEADPVGLQKLMVWKSEQTDFSTYPEMSRR